MDRAPRSSPDVDDGMLDVSELVLPEIGAGVDVGGVYPNRD